MKFKTTLILLAALAALLIFVLFILPEKPAEEAAKGPKLTDLKADEVEKIILKGESEMTGFQKDDKGDWLITEPLQAKADTYEVNRLAEDFSSLQAERVAEEKPADLARYGIPKKEVSLWFKGQPQPVKFLIGDENPVDNTLYAQKQGEQRVVLLSSSIKNLLDKKLLDFRQKDIFRFETGQARKFALRAKEVKWQASKKGEEWSLEKPHVGLADRFKVENILNALSGLRAAEFVCEEKTGQDLKAFGLDEPEVEAFLSLPAANQDVTFLLRKKDDKVYATTTLSSKIIRVEEQVLTDLEKKPEDVREKGVDIFNAWEADKLKVKTSGFELSVAKDDKGTWRFLSGAKGEADSSKVESFIRQVDYLEAKEFIDQPGSLSTYGLDKPLAEVRIRVKELEEQTREVTIFAGAEDTAKKEVVVRNPRLSYLLRVDSTFLSELPKSPKDWEKPKVEKDQDEKEDKSP